MQSKSSEYFRNKLSWFRWDIRKIVLTFLRIDKMFYEYIGLDFQLNNECVRWIPANVGTKNNIFELEQNSWESRNNWWT